MQDYAHYLSQAGSDVGNTLQRYLLKGNRCSQLTIEMQTTASEFFSSFGLSIYLYVAFAKKINKIDKLTDIK